MNDVKVYVDVDARFSKDGQLLPSAIIWEDGQRYPIDRVIDMQRCASRKAGGVGIRYTCIVGGRQSYLYYEVDKWFVERKTG